MANTASAAVSPKIAVITVHGTGDAAPDPQTPKWWEAGSAFADTLKQKLASASLEAEIIPFGWSGENSGLARDAGGEALSKVVADHAKRYRGVHLIGHSHGGNVANDAVCRVRMPEIMRARFPLLGWLAPRVDTEIRSLVTVGTPFFQTRLNKSESFNPIVAQALGVLGLFGAAIAPVIAYAFEEEGQYLWTGLALAATPLLLFGSWRLFQFAREEQRLSTRLTLSALYKRYKKAAPVTVYSIWHPNDEAISFLQKVEGLEVEPLAKGALLARSKRSAVVAGVRFAIWTMVVLMALGGVFGATLIGAGRIGVVDNTGVEGAIAGVATGAPLLLSALAAPLFFGVAYYLNRFIFGVLPEAGRGRLNGFIRSVLTGMAFGRDGAEAIGSVASRSHTFDTQEIVLDGPVAERMRDNASGAAGRLIEKYRWSLFSVGTDTNAALTDMATDAMTWDSLIHTTYFEQPEVVTLIADHIAEREGAAAK